VHDGEALMRAYAARDTEFFSRIRETSSFGLSSNSLPLEVINTIFRFDGAHRFIYDFDTLARAFFRAGFTRVDRSSFRGSNMPGLNLDLDLPDREIQSLYVEAVK
jgi:hypothetical protein